MSRPTSNINNLAIGCQYEDPENGFIAYIECTPLQPREVIRYRLVVKEADFIDRDDYYSVKVDVHSLPLFTDTVFIDGIRPSVKRNATTTEQLRKSLREWLEAL